MTKKKGKKNVYFFKAWNLRDGCLRNTTLGCGCDKFLQLKNMKLPLRRKRISTKFTHAEEE
jgi:hypothetical protein